MGLYRGLIHDLEVGKGFLNDTKELYHEGKNEMVDVIELRMSVYRKTPYTCPLLGIDYFLAR